MSMKDCAHGSGYVINAVLVEGRSVADGCEAHDISRSWLYELIGRYRELGDEELWPLSKRPGSSPNRVSAAVEEQIVALRKELSLGLEESTAPSRRVLRAFTNLTSRSNVSSTPVAPARATPKKSIHPKNL
jgi:hypothetical protein